MERPGRLHVDEMGAQSLNDSRLARGPVITDVAMLLKHLRQILDYVLLRLEQVGGGVIHDHAGYSVEPSNALRVEAVQGLGVKRGKVIDLSLKV